MTDKIAIVTVQKETTTILKTKTYTEKVVQI